MKREYMDLMTPFFRFIDYVDEQNEADLMLQQGEPSGQTLLLEIYCPTSTKSKW